ncbi:MAG: hypothetical protein BWY88_00718 [Synergistetes bacterium ADurb.Bin520]|nr:MAG: hypothetical protein BWY88_00718 [Synergistetes bacterium ADurb.Bin520]
MPRSPTPTTVMPMTVPPVKATRKAGFMPWMAEKAVFALALVATFMPTNPERALQRAPNTKDTAEATPICQKSNTPTTATKGASQRYSRNKKAMAPL